MSRVKRRNIPVTANSKQGKITSRMGRILEQPINATLISDIDYFIACKVHAASLTRQTLVSDGGEEYEPLFSFINTLHVGDVREGRNLVVQSVLNDRAFIKDDKPDPVENVWCHDPDEVDRARHILKAILKTVCLGEGAMFRVNSLVDVGVITRCISEAHQNLGIFHPYNIIHTVVDTEVVLIYMYDTYV